MAILSLFDRRRRRVRSALRARASGKPRLSVHRSGKHIYAQVIDDAAGKTVAAASTLDKDLKGKTGATRDGAAAVGKAIAARAKKAGVSAVVFD
ncbi:MAG: 50S ribosomal protein L18, partial [Sphingomicrobium sp.]